MVKKSVWGKQAPPHVQLEGPRVEVAEQGHKKRRLAYIARNGGPSIAHPDWAADQGSPDVAHIV